MLKEYKMQTSVCVWGGFVFGLFGFLLSVPGTAYEGFGRLTMMGGYCLLVCGGFMYARGKGYSWMTGVVSFLGPVGIAVIYLLRDKSAMVLKKRKDEEAV